MCLDNTVLFACYFLFFFIIYFNICLVFVCSIFVYCMFFVCLFFSQRAKCLVVKLVSH
jgi:hypothetical protein